MYVQVFILKEATLLYRSKERTYKLKLTKLMFGILPLVIFNNLQALENLSSLVIDAPFTVPANFYNVGDLYVIGNGSIQGNLLGGRSLHIGQDASNNKNPNNFITNNAIAGIADVHIHENSNFTLNHAMTGVTNQLVIYTDAQATINNSIIGAGGVLRNSGRIILNNNSSVYMQEFINDGVIYLNGNNANFSAILNNKNLRIAGKLSGYGTVENAPSATLTFTEGASNANIITNFGELYIQGTTLNTAEIINLKNMEIDADLNGNGSVNNKFSGVLNIKSSVSVNNSVINAGVLNVQNVHFSYLKNLGTLNLNAAINSVGNIDNAGIMNIYAAINMPGKTINNTGIINVYGQHSIVAANLMSQNAALNFTIYGANSNDSLDCSDTVDLTKGGVVNIDTQYFGPANTTYVWRLISAPNILIDDSTIVNTPSSLFKAWDINCGTDYLEVSNNNAAFATLASSSDHYAMACALDNLSQEQIATKHAPLFMALAASPNKTTFDNALQQLMPKQYNNAHYAAIQKSTLNKVETRMSNLRGTTPHIPTGISSGDINADTAFWTGAFGSLANQEPYSKSYGYYSKSLGGLIGIDRFCASDNIYGLALGISNSNLYENNQSSITRILGYHLILYGSTDFVTDSYFVEWLATGVINKNKTTRFVRINNSQFDVNSSYRTSQAGGRLNFGQSTDNDTWQFTLIETISYVLLYQPSYNEHNSSAALHVDPRRWSNVLTVGGGVRFALVEDRTWLRGDREIRFMGTYDAISTIQETTAGFINSVSDFTLSSAPARWSFQTGATYTFTYFERVQLQISYDFEMRTKYTDNSAEIRIKFLF